MFANLASPRAVKAALSGDVMARQPLTSAHIEFVLAFVGGDNPEEISERVVKVVEIAGTHQAVIHGSIGSLVIMAFGTLRFASPQAGGRLSLVEHLSRELSSGVKIIHGAADGHYGLIGGKNYMSYTFLMPRFDAILGALSEVEFGQVKEFGR